VTLSTVVVTWDEQDIGENALSGTITFALSQLLDDVTDGTIIEPVPLPFRFVGGTGTSDPLVANDSPSVIPSGTYYTVGVNIDGQPARSFTSPILIANGSSQTLAFLQSQAIVPPIPGVSYAETSGAVFTGPVVLGGGAELGAGLSPAVVPLTDASVIEVDAALGNDFEVTLGGNRQLGNPVGATDGQKILLVVTQPASGGPWSLTYGTAYEFGSGSPSLATGPGANDLLGFRYNGTKGKWQFLGSPAGGFA
jgi:hypothetical protein